MKRIKEYLKEENLTIDELIARIKEYDIFATKYMNPMEFLKNPKMSGYPLDDLIFLASVLRLLGIEAKEIIDMKEILKKAQAKLEEENTKMIKEMLKQYSEQLKGVN